MHNRMIIAICCDGFSQATEAYQQWISFLEEKEPEWLEECDEHTLSVNSGKIFRYVFFDEKLSSLFQFADSILYLDDFFQIEGVTDPWKGVMF